MSERRTAWLALAALLAAVADAPAATPDAQAVMAQVYGEDHSRDATLAASFTVYDASGHATVKKFLYRRLRSGVSVSERLTFTEPAEVRGVELLSVGAAAPAVRQYIYLPAQQRTRALAPQQRSALFLGTDFTFEDLHAHALGDFRYRLLGSGEPLDGHRTWLLEATPAAGADTQYSRIEISVAEDAPVILREKLYAADSAPVRVLTATRLVRVSGIWGARRLDMTTPAGHTHTVLAIDSVRFDGGLPASLFEPGRLPDPVPAFVTGKD